MHYKQHIKAGEHTLFCVAYSNCAGASITTLRARAHTQTTSCVAILLNDAFTHHRKRGSILLPVRVCV